MNGDRPQANGLHLTNGTTSTEHHLSTEAKSARIEQKGPSAQKVEASVQSYTNGVVRSPQDHNGTLANRLEDLPLEVLELVTNDHFVPVSTLLSRRVQACWNRLSSLVDELTEEVAKSSSTKSDDKAIARRKERILDFAFEQRSDFIKLLVLLDWSSRSKDFAKVASLNVWLHGQRRGFADTTIFLATLTARATDWQKPNPDFKTAGEILSTGVVHSFPDLGYSTVKPLSTRQILTNLKRLNRTLALRLAVDELIPAQLRHYTVHDGRATFFVTNEFEVDVSLLNDVPASQFQLVDFRFAFTPRPSIPDPVRTEIEFIANQNIAKDSLSGCYQFFHALTLSNKIAEYHRQALKAQRTAWAGHLRVELLRRSLVVRYWSEKGIRKSWIEIGVHSGLMPTTSGTDQTSRIAVSWYREGLEVQDVELELDPSHISLDTVLRQVIAQHITFMFNAMFDRLVATPTYQSRDLEIETCSSSVEPEACLLNVQITKQTSLTIAADVVNGSLIVSPASATSNQLQRDLNRSKNVVDEFTGHILSYRSTIAEGEILGKTQKSSWQHLSAFKPLMTDVKAVFKRQIYRVNFFRHPTWCSSFMMASTHGNDGDTLWVLQVADSFAASLVIYEEHLKAEDELTSGFFESFAGYASGVLVMHSIGQELQRTSQSHQINKIPTFRRINDFPSLFLDLGARPITSTGTSTSFHSAFQRTVEVKYLWIDSSARQSSMVFRLRCKAEAAVLQSLSQSVSDENVKIMPAERGIDIKQVGLVGEPVVDKVMLQISRLNDILMSIQMIGSLSNMTLTAITNTTLLIAYDFGQAEKWSMDIRLPHSEQGSKIDFLPKDANPHTYLAPQLTRLLQDRSKPFLAQLNSVVSTLALTSPLLSTLRQLQARQTSTDVSSGAHGVKVHVLVRQPTMFAVQFFAAQHGTAASGPTSQQRMLARFEILPYTRQKNMWLVRPAIEEFNRVAFVSKELQTKIKDEIFAKQDLVGEWMCLDTAAVCLVDKPKPLLQAIYLSVLDWHKENPSAGAEVTSSPVKTEPQKDPQQTAQIPASTANANRRPSGKVAPPTNKQMPNGVGNQQRQKNMPNKPQSGASKSNPKEVITLD